MLDDSSSGFEDDSASPRLYSSQKKNFDLSHVHDFTIGELHDRLIHHLKDANSFSKKELMWYLDQVQKITVEDHKNKWLLAKVKGLLHYILKKRSDFSKKVSEGEIAIFERSTSQQELSVTEIPEPPRYFSQPVGDQLDIASLLLTNYKFVSKVVSFQKENTMEIDENYSEDLFSNSIESLHREFQENLQIPKDVTQISDITISGLDVNEVLKEEGPSEKSDLETVHKVHDTLEENDNSSVPLTSSILQEPNRFEDYFNDLTISNSALQKNFESMREEMCKWMLELAEGLKKLQVSDLHTVYDVNTGESMSKENLRRMYRNEERLIQIREVCLKYKKFFKKRVETDKNFQMARDLLRSCE